MTPINDIPALLKAIVVFSRTFGSHLPTDAHDAFDTACSSVSPVVQICDVAEVLFAYQGKITDSATKAAAQTLAAQCALYGAMNGWHGLPVDNRGPAICWAMQRELGETAPSGTAWPTADKDPTIDARFETPAAAPEPAPAPAPEAAPAKTKGA
jgi:hypothetical protein